MNKSELIKSVAAKAGLTNKQAEAAYDAVIASIVEAFRDDEKVQLIGFGTFELKKKPAREGINPRTKEKVQIAETCVPAFKPGNPSRICSIRTEQKKTTAVRSSSFLHPPGEGSPARGYIADFCSGSTEEP